MALRVSPAAIALVCSGMAVACREEHAASLANAPAPIDLSTPNAAPGPPPSSWSGPLSPRTQSRIEHIVVLVQENHSFDAYFGRYCTAPAGSAPTCTTGPACCEAGPPLEPRGHAPVVLDDLHNLGWDPNHFRACMLDEINGGAMDRYVEGGECSEPSNFAYAEPTVVAPYHELARDNALADRYFQPIAGASCANDIYFARAGFAFNDNELEPATTTTCDATDEGITLVEPTIGDLLDQANVTWRWYSEGYDAMASAVRNGVCPVPPADCPAGLRSYPCLYDASDNPFSYFASGRDSSHLMDVDALEDDLTNGTLPAVSFVKALGYKSEHPGSTISAGVAFVRSILERVERSRFEPNTLVLLTWDESGGYFDHVTPPPPNAADGQPYGPRVPLLAIGPFARKNTVSHVTMDHASIVRFIEWNWLFATGQLGTRDATANGIGSLLDPSKTGSRVPE